MITITNTAPISQIRSQQKGTDAAKFAELENALAEAKAENLLIMEATAQVYEELQALKVQMNNAPSGP
ncbi:hypothetical protein BRE01_23990 [Brevibacillus reuszeri]|uniref:Uncharacterized protein n=1 Tax=Brevibacillus reuszeri TaxID=54915 RepID=A0A0K9YMS3_9BACL|nr:hypothetical protein [Brevibacillus reuszeri]KNB69942.1 hypothetical protein ADS79_29365 [Brevibacillus reuszeri]MED1858305.1 hypothetical protein [Brevibacillus reuszeri]GED68697.1 hypothetical protein BRE01_23990 [Brevibacillus reuszeri]